MVDFLTDTQLNELTELYIAYFARAPENDGLNFHSTKILDQLNASPAVSFADALSERANQFFFDAQAQPGITGFSASQTADEFVSLIYTNVLARPGIGGAAPTDAEKKFWTDQLEAGTLERGQVVQQFIAAQDILIASGTDAEKAGATAAKALFDNRTAVGREFAKAENSGTLTNQAAYDAGVAAINGVTSDPATVTAAIAVIQGSNGQTFTLTNAADTFTGAAQSDVFNANLVTNPANGNAEVETLTSLDVLDGGDGTDTLNYTTDNGVALPAATISNIETLNIVSGAGATADVKSIAALKTVTAKAAGGAVDIDTNGNVTSVTVTGTPTGVDIDDNSATDTLTTVSVTGATGAVALKSDAITSVNLDGVTGATTVTAAAATRSNAITSKDGTGAISDATATTVSLTTTGSTTASAHALTATAATEINVDAGNTKGTTVTATNFTAAKTVNSTGAAALTLDVSGAAALTKFDGSTAAGAQTVTVAATALDVDTGAGKDSITQAAPVGATQNINAGAGDDTVTISGAGSLANAGAVIDGGEGTDTLSLDDTVIAGATNDVEEKIFSNFEKLASDSLSANSTFDMANFDNINHLITNGTAANETLAVNNMATGGTLEMKADNGTGGTTVNVASAALGAADVFNIALTKDGVLVGDTVTVADVETINIASNSASTKTAAAINTLDVVADSATTIVVTGNSGLDLTGSVAAKVTNFDAGAVAGDDAVATDTAVNLAVKYVSGNATTTADVTITGGAGDDVLTGNAAKDTIFGNAGDDTLSGAAGIDVLSGGAGKDTLDGGTGVDSLTGGADDDTFVMTTVATSGTSYDTITDIAAGDVIQFGAVAVADGTKLGAATTAGANAVFQDYLDATVAAVATTDLGWFQFNGNTYIVRDASGTATFTNGTDNVVELTGLVDLSNSTSADAGLTIV